eukprot:41261-Eustigmatos_ZCMA.PRE.1
MAVPIVVAVCGGDGAGGADVRVSRGVPTARDRGEHLEADVNADELGHAQRHGEAQIAVVDLVGILLGISLSKMIGTARVGMAA